MDADVGILINIFSFLKKIFLESGSFLHAKPIGMRHEGNSS